MCAPEPCPLAGCACSAPISRPAPARAATATRTRSWSYVPPAGNKRGALDTIAELAGRHDIVGLQDGLTPAACVPASPTRPTTWPSAPALPTGATSPTATWAAWPPAHGLLSRLEPRLVEDHPLPGRVKGRGVLTARFGDGRDALTIMIAHLSLGSQSRRNQLDFIAELLSDLPHAVLMGDFNCDPDRPEMQALYRRTGLQPPPQCVPTFPSWRPQRAIDHMLVTPVCIWP